MRCPACEGSLNAVVLDDVQLEVCDRCGGTWFDRGELEVHLARGSGEPVASGEAPARTPAWRRCPRCAQPMTPRNFEKMSGVVIDVCHAHGAWVDLGEIRRLEAWWSSERRVRVKERSTEDRGAERRMASLGTDVSARAAGHARGGWFVPVLELLAEVPWFLSD